MIEIRRGSVTPAAPDSAAPAAGDVITFGTIGPGRVGSALTTALVAAGHHLTAVTGRSATGRPATGRSDAGRSVTGRADRLAAVLAGADLVLVTVPDDAIAAVADSLAPLVRPGQVIAHTSGANGLAVLAPVALAGAVPVALHPAMTFTGTAADLERLRAGVPFGVTAPEPAHRLVARIVDDLGGRVEWIAEERRPLYHAALAHGANHLVTLVNEAADRLRDAGVGEPAAVLGPLLSAALANALGHGDAALTGPVSRGDAGTVARHLAVLAEVAPESVPPYAALARRTVDRAVIAGRLPATDAGPLLDLLAEGDGVKR